MHGILQFVGEVRFPKENLRRIDKVLRQLPGQLVVAHGPWVDSLE